MTITNRGQKDNFSLDADCSDDASGLSDDGEGVEEFNLDQFSDPNKEAREAIMRRLHVDDVQAKHLVDKGALYTAVVSRLQRVCYKLQTIFTVV